MKNFFIFAAIFSGTTSALAQITLGCVLTKGEMLPNCDISGSICNMAFEIDTAAKGMKQTHGVYASSPIQVIRWSDAYIDFQQVANNDVHLRSGLNRLTGEMHIRADWDWFGQKKYRQEVWQCSVQKPIF